MLKLNTCNSWGYCVKCAESGKIGRGTVYEQCGKCKKNDTIKSAYTDSLTDIDSKIRFWFKQNYIPHLQKVLNIKTYYSYYRCYLYLMSIIYLF